MTGKRKAYLNLCWEIPVMVALAPIAILCVGVFGYLEGFAFTIQEEFRWAKVVDGYREGNG